MGKDLCVNETWRILSVWSQSYVRFDCLEQSAVAVISTEGISLSLVAFFSVAEFEESHDGTFWVMVNNGGDRSLCNNRVCFQPSVAAS